VHASHAADAAGHLAIGIEEKPRTSEGLQRLVEARTVHGGYGAEARAFRRLLVLLEPAKGSLSAMRSM
jgi:hypothetical protein